MTFNKSYRTTAIPIIFAVALTFIYSITYAADPVNHDFDEVQLNSTSKATVNISTSSSKDVILESFTFQNGMYFKVISEIPDGGIVVPPNQMVGIEIAFTPTILGTFADILYIRTDNPFIGRVVVNLSGTGVPATDTTIDNILGFFDLSVASGSMIGNGGSRSNDNLLASSQKKNKSKNEGKSAENKLHALRNMLVTAGKLIESEDVKGACGQLKAASDKCDGDNSPPDFVIGVANPDPVPQLENMIVNLSESLGCM